MKKRVFVTGGAGYVGTMLVRKLLAKNYIVDSFDLMLFGNTLPKHLKLTSYSGDIRDKKKLENCLKEDTDIFIHLACISNDPSFELDPKLGKSINYDCFPSILKICKKKNIKRFIYASSSSVYGIKKTPEVTEQENLLPLTDYSKFKADCENILFNYKCDFDKVIIRPATVCGFSYRQRFDVIVNILTNFAFFKREITILGGKQLRPNIHMDDMTDVYLKIIEEKKEKVNNHIFNAGRENFSVETIAEKVRKIIGADVNIIKKNSNDNRSYHISSKKIQKKLNFEFKKSIEDAVNDLKLAFINKKLTDTLNNKKYFNIKTLKDTNLL